MAEEKYQNMYDQAVGVQNKVRSEQTLFQSVSLPSDFSQYDEIFKNTPYYNEFLVLIDAYFSAHNAAPEMYLSERKQARYEEEARQTLTTGISNLLAKMREADKASIQSQVDEQTDAGLNPFLNGSVDTGASATGGSGIAHDTSVQNAPDIAEPLDVVGGVFSALATFVSFGTSIATTVMNAGSLAVNNLLKQEQASNLSLARDSYLQQYAEQYVLDHAPKFEDGELYPGFTISEIPGIAPEFQEQAVQFAKNYVGSDRHRQGLLSQNLGIESDRYSLASLFGSGFYSTSMQEMSSAMVRYSNMKLDFEEKVITMQNKFADVQTKYLENLDPEIMADVINSVNRYQAGLYDNLDPQKIASATNAEATFQSDVYSAQDGSLAGEVVNQINRYNSVLYDNLSPEQQAQYDNAFNEFNELSSEYQTLLVNTDLAIVEQLKKDLQSSDPAVRITAAKEIQRRAAKSRKRQNMTGWDRFSQGAKLVTGVGLAVGSAVATAGGSIPLTAGAAGVGLGAGMFTSSSSMGY